MVSLKVKEILCIVYSALLFISGLLLIVFSAILCYRIFYHFTFIPGSALGPFIVLFLLGFVHLFLTWLGVKGPSREHDFHIILFMVITAILLVAECAVGIWAMVHWDEVDVESVQLMTQSFGDLAKENFVEKDKSWTRMESKLKCCGLNGIADYKSAKETPLSCCNFEIKDGACQIFHDSGCKTPLMRYVKAILIHGAIMAFTCCLFQALGLFVFFTFFRTLKEERQARIQRRLAVQRRLSQENGSTANPAAGPPVAPVSAPPHDMATP